MIHDQLFQGQEIAESAIQHVQPENDLEVGSLIEEFDRHPTDKQMVSLVSKTGGSFERAHGKILDENVQTGR